MLTPVRRPLEGFEPRQRSSRSSNADGVAEALQARDDGARDQGGRQLAGLGRRSRRLVGLADDARPPRRFDIIEKLHQLVLDEAALLFDDQDVFDALREGQGALRLQRPGQRDFIDADAEFGGARFSDAELGERLPHVEIGLAGGDDAQPRLRRIDHHAVEAVGAGERRAAASFGPCRRRSCSSNPCRRAASGYAGRPTEGRNRLGYVTGRAADRRRPSGAVDGFARRLERHPAAGKPRQRETEQPEIEIILDRRRIEDRHHRRLKGLLALISGGGALRAVIVARDGEHAAVGCAVPAQLAWRSTSSERSTPGPLPYQMPNTPSTVAPGNRPTCWLPHTAVAAGLRSARAGSGCRFAPAAPWPATARCRKCRAASRDSRR